MVQLASNQELLQYVVSKSSVQVIQLVNRQSVCLLLLFLVLDVEELKLFLTLSEHDDQLVKSVPVQADGIPHLFLDVKEVLHTLFHGFLQTDGHA